MKHTSGLIEIVIPEYKPSIFAEIGVHKGHTTRSILRSDARFHIKEYWAIDQWDLMQDDIKYNVYTRADWDHLYKNAARYMIWFNRLRVLKLPSVEAAELFWDGYFDMVYLDANHGYEAVKEDIETWLPKVKQGGILGGHDYNKGKKKGHKVKEAVLDFWNEEELELYGDGLWLKHL